MSKGTNEVMKNETKVLYRVMIGNRSVAWLDTYKGVHENGGYAVKAEGKNPDNYSYDMALLLAKVSGGKLLRITITETVVRHTEEVEINESN